MKRMPIKTKVWRGAQSAHYNSTCVYDCMKEHENCTVIPDGAVMPLPPSVKRLLKEALKLTDADSKYRNVKHEGLLKAASAYRKSIAKTKAIQ